jgi:CDP-6-deoxy-D-xylo-4-hexulose-3-dehydrase
MEYETEVKTLIRKFVQQLKDIKHIPPYQLNQKSKFNAEIDSVLYSGPFFDYAELEAAITSLLTSKWASSGENIRLFERQFSKKFNTNNSTMVNSGSSANLVMIAALKKYYKWKDGDEVIISVVGFPTTLSALLINKLKPVFVDIDFKDLNWDLNQIEKKITNKTKAIFSSPVLGNPFDIDHLMRICNNYNLLHILDNCDSLGSKWKNKYLSDFAVASSTSFYPAHHISTFEGGMISSNNEEIIKIAKSISGWGRACYCMGRQNLLPNGTCGKRFNRWIPECDFDVDHKYVFDNIGYNLKALDLQGAIGSVQLTKFEEIVNTRRRNYLQLKEILEKVPNLRIIAEQEYAFTSWFGVPIYCEDSGLKSKLVRFLETNRIQTRNYFAGNILLQPAYRDLGNSSDFPNANKVLEHVFFLGTSPTISSEMIEYIGKVIEKFCALDD